MYIVWKHLPLELKPGGIKNRQNIKLSTKKTKTIDINSRLSILEQNELQGGKKRKLDDDDLELLNKEDNDVEDKEEELDDEHPDEEMDTGTDYVCDYFDNGEAFDDEDDNLDEPCF
ncbi:DNA-directed RNA polymerase III subunit RPC7-like [Ctenocephalides felis]|uniref:DNA-directed RNA polymerase III subunit RPC7-like n=1 Tax=Ctenocephalides felis TaxID=7515 RepID=UPI000E6E4512|nr:DNA-directed RNA polymerase III subunit RPC7-like [Ctenocephalides felis]